MVVLNSRGAPRLVCWLLAVLLPAAAAAQSDALLAARHSAQELYGAGQYVEAEAAAREAIRLAEQEFGVDHPEAAIGYNDLADILWTLDRFAEAEPLLRRALTVLRAAPGSYAEMAIGMRNNLATLLDQRGEWEEAEELYQEAIELARTRIGPRSPLLAKSLSNQGALYRVQGRFEEAEALYRQALEIKEENHREGPSPETAATVATTLTNLANLYDIQGRTDEAFDLFDRALAMRIEALGEEHPDVAYSKDKLASMYRDRGGKRYYRKAMAYYEEALQVYEATFDELHPRIGLVIRNLGSLYFEMQEWDEAEGYYKRALELRRRAVRQGRGPAFPQIPTALIDLGNLYWFRSLYDRAEPLYREALELQQAVLSPGHPEIALSLHSLANLHFTRGQYPQALETVRRASDIRRARASRFSGRQAGILSEQRKNRETFLLHALAAVTVFGSEPQRQDELLGEAFEAIQLAQVTSIAGAVARMAARFGAGSDALAAVVRSRQEKVDRWLAIDEELIEALTLEPEERDDELERQLRQQAVELDREIAALDRRLADEFPEYAELAGQRPVSLEALQGVLAEDEALLSFAVWRDRTFIWVVRRDRAAQRQTIGLGLEELGDRVADLRASLDVTGGQAVADLPLFDTALAHELYRQLVEPVASELAGAGTVYVVPDGPLASLPLGVLVTSPPPSPPADLAGYRDVAWLADEFAMTVLPAASSLRALRVFAARARAAKPFLGVGDPVLDGAPGGGTGALLPMLYESETDKVDLAVLRGMPRLPDTASELAQIAASLMAPPEEALRLGRDASESVLRRAMLDDYRIVGFATHGLLAGEMAGVPEPALVLTPPDEISADNDGLLTAGEIAQLKFNADWVVLSACNTAAGDSAGGEGLSGLAKAFIYAGSRAMLVSHWPVESQASARLTTRMFAAMDAEPGLGRAEALKRSMAALRADDAEPQYAYPLYWAPFVVVGEGGPVPAADTG